MKLTLDARSSWISILCFCSTLCFCLTGTIGGDRKQHNGKPEEEKTGYWRVGDGGTSAERENSLQCALCSEVSSQSLLPRDHQSVGVINNFMGTRSFLPLFERAFPRQKIVLLFMTLFMECLQTVIDAMDAEWKDIIAFGEDLLTIPLGKSRRTTLLSLAVDLATLKIASGNLS